LGSLVQGENVVFPGDITWSFSTSTAVKDGVPVSWITGSKADGRVLYNYSVVPITF